MLNLEGSIRLEQSRVLIPVDQFRWSVLKRIRDRNGGRSIPSCMLTWHEQASSVEVTAPSDATRAEE
jgi:hypothetical protein